MKVFLKDVYLYEDVDITPEKGPLEAPEHCGTYLRPRKYGSESKSNIYVDLEEHQDFKTMLQYLGARKRAKQDFFGTFIFAESEDPEDSWSEKRLVLSLDADGTCDYFDQEIVNRESPAGTHYIGIWELEDTCITCTAFGVRTDMLGALIGPPHLQRIYFTKVTKDSVWPGHPDSQGEDAPIVRVGYSQMECSGVLKRSQPEP